MGLACALVASAPASAHAFVADGHRVIEAQAYKQLVAEGCDDDRGRHVPGDQVLREFIAAGLLDAPTCPGGSSDCESRRQSDPLSWWPPPHSDEPDMVLSRQFSREGQCFHFMAMSSDESVAAGADHSTTRCVDPRGGAENVSCGLVCSAYNSCIETLTTLAYNVAWADAEKARSSHEGLYELMHAVADSYSRAHVEREHGSGRIHYLRVWQPIAASPLANATQITRHAAPSDDRDDDTLDRFSTWDGHLCTYYTKLPYGAPTQCLTSEAKQAVSATKDLLCEVRAMRAEHAPRALSATEAVQSHTKLMRASARWPGFLARYFPHAHAELCTSDAYRGRQEREHVPRLVVAYSANYTYANPGDMLRNELGVRIFNEGTAFEPAVIRGHVGVGVLRSPLFGSVTTSTTNEPYVATSIDVLLPLGDVVTIGTTPLVFDIGLAKSTATFDVVARPLRVELAPLGALRGTWVGLAGPFEYYYFENVVRPSVGLAFGAVV
jgi:hypothetical protein